MYRQSSCLSMRSIVLREGHRIIHHSEYTSILWRWKQVTKTLKHTNTDGCIHLATLLKIFWLSEATILASVVCTDDCTWSLGHYKAKMLLHSMLVPQASEMPKLLIFKVQNQVFVQSVQCCEKSFCHLPHFLKWETKSLKEWKQALGLNWTTVRATSSENLE